MSDSEPDHVEKVVETEESFKLQLKQKRGTGTRDQDTVNLKFNTEEPPSPATISGMVGEVNDAMDSLRAHQPDAEDGDGDD